MDRNEAARVKDEFDRNNVPPPPDIQAQIDAALAPVAETAQPIRTIQATKTPEQVMDIPETPSPPPPQPSEKAQAFIEQRKEPAKSIIIPGKPILQNSISKGAISTYSKPQSGTSDKVSALTLLPENIQPMRKQVWDESRRMFVVKHSYDGESWVEDKPSGWQIVKESIGLAADNPYVQVATIAFTIGLGYIQGRPPKFEKLNKLATAAGNANTAVETELSIQKGYTGVVGELPKSSSKLQQAIQKSYKADRAFLNELGKAKNMNLSTLFKLEQKSGIDGITKNVVDIGAEQERVNNAWSKISGMRYYPTPSTPAQEKVNIKALKALDELNTAQNRLVNALKESENVIAPRYKPGTLPTLPQTTRSEAAAQLELEIQDKNKDVFTKYLEELERSKQEKTRADIQRAFDEWKQKEATKTQPWERSNVAVAEKPVEKPATTKTEPITTPEPKPDTPASKASPKTTVRTTPTPRIEPKKYETPDQERERIRREQEYLRDQSQEQEAVVSRPIDTTLPTRFTVPNKFTYPTTTPTTGKTPTTTPTTGVTPTTTISTTTTTTPTTTPSTPTETKPALTPETPTKQTIKTIITPITPPTKDTPTKTTPPTTKIPPPGSMLRLLPGMSDKEKREVIEKAGGAFTWQQGELNDKKVHHVVVNPFTQSDKTTVLGKPPAGAKQVSGAGQSKSTLRLLFGDGPAKPTMYEGGAIDPVVRSIGTRKVRIDFIPDRRYKGRIKRNRARLV